MTRNVPCDETGVPCTKAVYINLPSVRIRLVDGASPSVNDVAMSNGLTTFTGGEIDVNDMFQYVRLDSGVEILFNIGNNNMLIIIIVQLSSNTL